MITPVRRHFWGDLLSSLLLVLTGCQAFVEQSDRQVYALIEQRQREALGQTHPARIDDEHVPARPDHPAYEFVPHPTDSDVPPELRRKSAKRPALTNLPPLPVTSAP